MQLSITIASHPEWIEARKALLVKEKEYTRLGDETRATKALVYAQAGRRADTPTGGEHG